MVMAHRHNSEAVPRKLKNGPHLVLSMSGIVVQCFKDSRKILPVFRAANRPQIFSAWIKKFCLVPLYKRFIWQYKIRLQALKKRLKRCFLRSTISILSFTTWQSEASIRWEATCIHAAFYYNISKLRTHDAVRFPGLWAKLQKRAISS